MKEGGERREGKGVRPPSQFGLGLGGLIRLQCIYNFLLFHAIILSIYDVLYAILYDFWD